MSICLKGRLSLSGPLVPLEAAWPITCAGFPVLATERPLTGPGLGDPGCRITRLVGVWPLGHGGHR